MDAARGLLHCLALANFATHLIGAACVSAAASGTTWLLGLLSPGEAAIACGLGIVGGLLPDIDAEGSTPTRLVFTGVGIAAAGLAVMATGALGIPLQIGAAAAGYALGRYGLAWVFGGLSVHRGLVHSVPVAALCGVGLAIACARLIAVDARVAWIWGLLVTVGFVAHLLLDELASVDLTGGRLKRSFGTALKLGSRRNLIGTALVYAALAGLLSVAPPPRSLPGELTSGARWRNAGRAVRGLFDQRPIVGAARWRAATASTASHTRSTLPPAIFSRSSSE